MQQQAFTVNEFCDAHRISRSAYYTLPIELRPVEFRVGKSVRITVEAATDWRRKMEKYTAANPEPAGGRASGRAQPPAPVSERPTTSIGDTSPSERQADTTT